MQKLHNTDCLEIMTKIPDNSIDCIVTDPPYGVNFKNDFYDDSKAFVERQSVLWLDSMHSILKNNAHCFVFTGTKSLTLWLNNIEKSEFQFNNIVNVPAYCNGQHLKNNFYFRTDHILYLSKANAKKFNKVDMIPTSKYWLNDKRNPNPKPFTYSYPNFLPNFFSNVTQNRIHPNQKNIKLLEFFISLSTNEGDVVLDPFMGSGSTGVAAQNLSRDFVGVELDKECFDMTKKRLNNEKQQN